MLRSSLRVPKRLLALILLVLVGCLPAAAWAVSPPTLFSVTASQVKVLAQGAQKSYPITLSESNALDAVFQGGMWLPNPSGGRIYAKYQRHILHANGTWTWIGTVQTVHGPQSVVITFGKDGVFGLIPQASGYPLRIVTRNGQTRMLETSAAGMASSAENLRLHSQPDFLIPPRLGKGAGALQRPAKPADSAAVPVQAADASGEPVIIDIMVAYTPGFVSELGSQNLALTRIQNLVDLTNQAYIDSGVNQQILLVDTVEVDYPDDTSNQSALDDLTGVDDNGNPVTIPASLQGIAALRVQYGADLVSLVRAYDNATQSNCGVGWLIGGDQTPIIPDQSNAYGYSVVSDGSNGGYYCLDTTFAHELGHNMGNAHDRAHAAAGGGAYPYSYGYDGNGTDGFSTIMAYGTATDTPLAVFSNPNISTCQNTPCGVADSASDSADNAHSMNNTAPLIAQFEPAATQLPSVTSTHVHNDITGDGSSDLLWYNAQLGEMTYWVMNGPTMTAWQELPVPSGYQPIATGDFDGNGAGDILWKSSTGEMYMWLSDGSSFESQDVGPYPTGWILAGTGDLNGDGKTDLLWYNPGSGLFSYWLMNGASLASWQSFQTSPGLQPVAVGNFDGNDSADIIWKTTSGEMYMWLFNTDGTFTYHDIGPYPKGWVTAGTGDVNRDGKSDLFWYNPRTGQMTYWLMDGATMTSWQGYQTNTGLTPLATGMFDGSHAGLTWEAPSGAMYMWTFNGPSLSYSLLGNYPAGWVAIP